VQGRRGRAGAEFAIGFLKDFGELWGHVEERVAEAAISSQPSAISHQPSVNILELWCSGCSFVDTLEGHAVTKARGDVRWWLICVLAVG
jgi:hypothetical protein